MRRRSCDGQAAEIVVLCPHFEPDNAPTGTVMTRIVRELVGLGHCVHVVTALPWYHEHRIEPSWEGKLVRRELTPWGSITRVHPFPGDDKTDLARRAFGFVASSTLMGLMGLRAGRGWFRRTDVVLAMSPPLTLGMTGWFVARLRRARMVFNIQDVFPDAAIEIGAISNRYVIGIASWVERLSYRSADAVTVLSDDLADNVRGKLPVQFADTVHVIPNFVDTEAIVPDNRLTALRAELGVGDEPVVLYAGNLGFSQSFGLLFHAARHRPDVTFLIVGAGAARIDLDAQAAGLANVLVRDYVDVDRLPELLATGDIHVVPLKKGLGRVSVPSKIYSIMAAGRPALAAIDSDTAVPAMLDASGGGIAVEPDNPEAFLNALNRLLALDDLGLTLGAGGRRWVVAHAAPRAVGAAYSDLLDSLAHR